MVRTPEASTVPNVTPPPQAKAHADLAGRINAAHERCAAAVRTGLEHAIEAGRLLMEAKSAIGHGSWSEWVVGHCRFGIRTAQGYMRLARNAPAMDSNTQPVAFLGIKAALEALADTSESDYSRANNLRQTEEPCDGPNLIPPSGKLLFGERPDRAVIVIFPHEAAGYVHIAAMIPDSFGVLGEVAGTKRGLRADQSPFFIEECLRVKAEEFEWTAIDAEPSDYNDFLYLGGKQEYIDHAILGRKGAK